MADGVNLPPQGTGDSSVKASTQKVTADSSDVQDVSLTAVVGGVRTRNPTLPVSAVSLPLPTGAALDASVTAHNALFGAVTETAPASDTASSGLNGRLQRVAQRLTSLIALLPASLGQKASAASLAVVVASDQSAVPVSGTVTATGPLTDTQLRASAVPISAAALPLPTNAATDATVALLQVSGGTAIGSLKGQIVDATATASAPTYTEGTVNPLSQTLAGALRVGGTVTANIGTPGTLALDASVTAQSTLVGAVTETAPATDTASSGLNGRLQRVAQRLSTIIGVLPTALGANGGLKIEGVASGTVVPVSGTVTTTPPSNASTNVAQVAGTTTDTNSGAKSAGTLRVTLATDQVQLTNALKVDPSAVTSPVSLATNTPIEVRAATGAAPVAFTAVVSTQVFASNASRKRFTVFNNSNADLYLMEASAAVSVTSYHVKVAANGGYYAQSDYSGEIRGILSTAVTTGQVNPGEFT